MTTTVSRSLSECRLLIDPPSPGTWNMAVDEMLLEWAAEERACCWRMYQWSEPTLSLGYFQAYAERRQHPASQGCAAVRRLTGGGAIVHDQELTYSLVVPAGHALAAQRDSLYRTVHTSLIEVLSKQGITANLHHGPCSRETVVEPFLCFQRRSPGDLLVGSSKVAGSAQRRRQGAVLQHGSVLLRRSNAAPELTGMEELTGVAWSAEGLIGIWLGLLATRLAVSWNPCCLSPTQRSHAAELQEHRYASSPWTEHRRR